MILEDRLTKLEEEVKKNNKNITDGLQGLIDTLEEMRQRGVTTDGLQALIDKLKEMREGECQLPPGCEQE